MKTLIVLPDGVGIRNFLCTQFIDLLMAHGEVIIWHALSEETLAPYQHKWKEKVRWYALPQTRESTAERILRQSKIYAHRYWQCEYYYVQQAKQGRSLSALYNQGVGMASRVVGRVSAGPRRLRALEKLHAYSVSRSRHIALYEDFLRREKPDVVFCAHQRASRAVPAMIAARKLGIPTSTFIYSWDNLPKGRMAVHADYFMVWSNHMKGEMLRYYPEVKDNRVRAVGTPQFEHYFNTSLLQSREDFLGSLGLDPTRPVICFSGDDITTSPHDPVYLSDLAESLRSVQPLEARPQVLFRRCPVDTSGRYQHVLDKYQEIAVSDPLWVTHHDGDWTQVVPTEDDIALLVNVVAHSDAVVNLGSTMALDFAILDKPSIYLAYNPCTESDSSAWNIESAYKLPHFRTVHELQPVYWARSREALSSLVMHALALPAEKSEARHQWLNRIVALPLDSASTRLHDALQEIALKSARRSSYGGQAVDAHRLPNY